MLLQIRFCKLSYGCVSIKYGVCILKTTIKETKATVEAGAN